MISIRRTDPADTNVNTSVLLCPRYMVTAHVDYANNNSTDSWCVMENIYYGAAATVLDTNGHRHGTLCAPPWNALCRLDNRYQRVYYPGYGLVRP